MKKNKIDYILYAMPFVFYIFFAIYDGPIICDDTHTYLNMDIMREPLYPLFLRLFNIIFGNKIYLNIVVLVQGIIMALALCYIINELSKRFKLNSIFKISILIIFICVSLLSKYASKKNALFLNCIISEAITYPLYMFFICFLLSYLILKDNKYLLYSSITSFLLISTRKQMYVTLILIIIAIVYIAIVTKKYKEFLIKMLIVFLCIFGGNKVFDFCYTKIINDVNVTHTSDNRFINTMIIYCGDESLSKFIEDYTVKNLYLDIIKECRKEKVLKEYESGSWYEKSLHFSNSYDKVQQIVWNVERKYIQDNYDVSVAEREIIVDEYNDVIIDSLLFNNKLGLFDTIIKNFLFGLVITISAARPEFVIVSIIIFIAYFILLIINILKKGFDNSVIFSLLILSSIIINTAIVSIVIFCQTRYTIYNLGFFYVSMIILFNSLLNEWRARNEK